MIYESTQENIQKAAELIKCGEVVAFPTETVYGLAANALNPQAVQKIFDLKERPNFNPLIVHLLTVEQIEEVSTYKNSPRLVELLEKVQRFWPGPLSVILPKREEIPSVVTGGLETVAIRIPSHPIARSFIKACACPIAAPSANKFTHISPTKAEHVQDSLGDQVFILDGGSTPVGLESTVISLVPDPPQLLRPGFVTFEELQAVLNDIEHGEKVSLRPPSPGMLKRHYAPNTPLMLRGSTSLKNLPKNCGLVSFKKSEKDLHLFKEVITLSENSDLEEVSSKLFNALHELDKKGLDLILIDSCPEHGLGLAIMDRISRATKR
jgi:L-threonylcarbamoyladenylate synthase